MPNHTAIVDAACFTPNPEGRWGLNLILWGEPGTVKTSTLKSLAASTGLVFNSTIMSISEPADLAGYPIPNNELTMVKPLPSPWIHRVNEAQGALQLFDEATSCSSAAHAALMRVVLDGMAGDFSIHPRVRFMMAANPPECAANANPLSIPLANRFGHLDFDPGEPADWVQWVLGGADRPEQASPKSALQREKRVMEGWGAAFAAARSLVGSFIERRPQLLHRMPEAEDGQSSRAWPSRRTWDMAMHAYAGAKVNGLSEADTYAFVAAFVGQGPTTEFQQFVKKLDLPKAEDLLDGKVKFKHSAKRFDRTMAVLNDCTTFIQHDAPGKESKHYSKWLERVEAYWEICQHVIDSNGADAVMPSAKTMCKRRYNTNLFEKSEVRNSAVYGVMKDITELTQQVFKVR